MSYLFAISSNMPTWIVYVIIAIGLASCFLGYKLLRVWMALIGFVIGMAIGYFASYNYFSNMVIPIIIGFSTGVLIGFIAYRIYLLGVFLIALVTTLDFLGQLLVHYNELDWVCIVLMVILALVVAIIAIKFVKPVIIISTALNGATIVMVGIFKLLQIDAKHMLLIAALLLAVLGIMVQFFTNKNSEDKK